MPIIPLKCPSCGAQLQADSDSAILTCKYCGTNSVMKDAIVQNYIQNTVNINAATVNVCSQKDFVIRGGVLEKYCGESVEGSSFLRRVAINTRWEAISFSQLRPQIFCVI